MSSNAPFSLSRGQGKAKGRGRGYVAGAVFAEARRSAGLSQERTAEALGVSVDLVANWESGRRSLARANAEDLWHHEQVLLATGASPELVSLLGEAIRADFLLGQLLRDPPGAELHPLVTMVPGRDLTELLAWPISGVPPRQLRDRPHTRRIRLPDDERIRLVESLIREVETAPAGERGAMLRRQASYLAARHPAARGWVADQSARRRRAVVDVSAWTPEWAVERSQAISDAAAGDMAPLERFIRTGLATDQTITANLSYWAYWVGEVPARWRADSQMAHTPVDSWPGHQLLTTLTAGLAEGAPYRDLCAVTVHSLLLAKPHLAAVPEHRTRLNHAIDVALSSDHGVTTSSARQLLEQAAFFVRSYHR